MLQILWRRSDFPLKVIRNVDINRSTLKYPLNRSIAERSYKWLITSCICSGEQRSDSIIISNIFRPAVKRSSTSIDASLKFNGIVQ